MNVTGSVSVEMFKYERVSEWKTGCYPIGEYDYLIGITTPKIYEQPKLFSILWEHWPKTHHKMFFNIETQINKASHRVETDHSFKRTRTRSHGHIFGLTTNRIHNL